jgi:hypothetical protein
MGKCYVANTATVRCQFELVEDYVRRCPKNHRLQASAIQG